MELLNEEEKVMVDMTFDMSEEEIEMLLNYAKEHYSEEDEMRDKVNFAMNKILREFVETHKENENEREESDQSPEEDAEGEAGTG